MPVCSPWATSPSRSVSLKKATDMHRCPAHISTAALSCRCKALTYPLLDQSCLYCKTPFCICVGSDFILAAVICTIRINDVKNIVVYFKQDNFNCAYHYDRRKIWANAFKIRGHVMYVGGWVGGWGYKKVSLTQAKWGASCKTVSYKWLVSLKAWHLQSMHPLLSSTHYPIVQRSSPWLKAHLRIIGVQTSECLS